MKLLHCIQHQEAVSPCRCCHLWCSLQLCSLSPEACCCCCLLLLLVVGREWLVSDLETAVAATCISNMLLLVLVVVVARLLCSAALPASAGVPAGAASSAQDGCCSKVRDSSPAGGLEPQSLRVLESCRQMNRG